MEGKFVENVSVVNRWKVWLFVEGASTSDILICDYFVSYFYHRLKLKGTKALQVERYFPTKYVRYSQLISQLMFFLTLLFLHELPVVECKLIKTKLFSSNTSAIWLDAGKSKIAQENQPCFDNSARSLFIFWLRK